MLAPTIVLINAMTILASSDEAIVSEAIVALILHTSVAISAPFDLVDAKAVH